MTVKKTIIRPGAIIALMLGRHQHTKQISQNPKMVSSNRISPDQWWILTSIAKILFRNQRVSPSEVQSKNQKSQGTQILVGQKEPLCLQEAHPRLSLMKFSS